MSATAELARVILAGSWQPRATAPEGEMLLWWCPKIDRGRPGCEVLMFYRECPSTYADSYWTNGGPNGGDDFYFQPGEEPTHWMPLPAGPTS